MGATNIPLKYGFRCSCRWLLVIGTWLCCLLIYMSFNQHISDSSPEFIRSPIDTRTALLPEFTSAGAGDQHPLSPPRPTVRHLAAPLPTTVYPLAAPRHPLSPPRPTVRHLAAPLPSTVYPLAAPRHPFSPPRPTVRHLDAPRPSTVAMQSAQDKLPAEQAPVIPAGNGQFLPAGNGQFLPAGNDQFLPAGNDQFLPAGNGQFPSQPSLKEPGNNPFEAFPLELIAKMLQTQPSMTADGIYLSSLDAPGKNIDIQPVSLSPIVVNLPHRAESPEGDANPRPSPGSPRREEPSSSALLPRCLVPSSPGSTHMVELSDLPGGVVTAASLGRLGNNLMEYATTFALGLRLNITPVDMRVCRYNVTPVATPCLLRSLGGVFPNTTMPVVADECVQNFTTVSIDDYENMTDDKRAAKHYRMADYLHRVRLFWQYRDHLMHQFSFRRDLTVYAQSLLRQAADGQPGRTFIGVHVRRTDFARHLQLTVKGHLVNESFYHSAMDLCRRWYHEPIFNVTSDDLKWCREHLSAPDVHILGDGRSASPGTERDLALLAACNHTIFDYGTYGFFAAFLAGGHMILADGFSDTEPEMVRELRIGNINATFLNEYGQLLERCIHCDAEYLRQ